MSLENSFIYYNWMPLVAQHAMDLSADFYESAGVSRLHNHETLDPASVRDGDVIFVKTDYIFNGVFQNKILPQIKSKFTLVSGISSYHVGSNGDTSYQKMINSPNVLKWYCTNPPLVQNDKIIPIPIGFEERERPGGNQESITKHFEEKTPFGEKKDKILLPYHTLETNPRRNALCQFLKHLPFVDTQERKLPWTEYMALVNEYKFVVCLEGSGPDVHRNYECLLVNSVPINVENTIQSLFEYHSLPGVFIDSWISLSENRFKEMLKNDYNFTNVENFLKVEYHVDLIKNS
jgi:hypothetical protein